MQVYMDQGKLLPSYSLVHLGWLCTAPDLEGSVDAGEHGVC